MADWHTYQDSELPIHVPPADLAWEDMRSRLEQEEHRALLLWPRMLLTAALLLSWLVILEPAAQKGKKDIGIAGNHAPGHSTTGLLPQSQSLHLIPSSGIAQALVIQKTRRPARQQNIPTSTATIAEDPINTLPTVESSGNKIDTTRIVQKTPKPADSIAKTATAPEDPTKKEKEKWKIRISAQWEWQIPTTGIYGYFDGPSTNPELWRSLIPGLYLEAVHEKNALSFSFMPMQSQMVANKPFRVQNSLLQMNDTTVSREETKHLYKILGMSASIGYARNLHNHWWTGLSLQASWWQQALAVSNVHDNYIVSGQVVGQQASSYAYKLTDEWSYFNKMQTFLQADLIYREYRWQGGLKAGMALTPFSKEEGPAHMFRTSLFFRYSFGK